MALDGGEQEFTINKPQKSPSSFSLKNTTSGHCSVECQKGLNRHEKIYIDTFRQGITLKGTAHMRSSSPHHHSPPTGVVGMRLDTICHYWLLHLLFHFSVAWCCRLTSAVRTDPAQGSHHLQPPLIPLSLPSCCVSSLFSLTHSLAVLFRFFSLFYCIMFVFSSLLYVKHSLH